MVAPRLGKRDTAKRPRAAVVARERPRTTLLVGERRLPELAKENVPVALLVVVRAGERSIHVVDNILRQNAVRVVGQTLMCELLNRVTVPLVGAEAFVFALG